MRKKLNNKLFKKLKRELFSILSVLGIIIFLSLIIGSEELADNEKIIRISKAKHLDSNRVFVSEIYNLLKEKDDSWLTVRKNDFLRISFEKKLTSKNDITIFARKASSDSVEYETSRFAEIAVFKEDSNEEIARFENITSENWHKIYLTGLNENESYEVFDLKMLNNPVEFDYIVDPIPGATNVSNCMTLNTANTYYQLNTSIVNDTITTDCIIISKQNITFDCDGYSISSTKNFTGVYTNQRNTTVKNCNVSMGSGANTNALGIEMTDAADYSSIINNTIIGGMDIGISFAPSNNGPEYCLIENNTVDVSVASATDGIVLRLSHNNTIKGNTAISKSANGIGIFTNSVNNSLISNTGISTSGKGFQVASSAANNILISNTGISNSSQGIDIGISNNNILTNNTGISNSNYGIVLTDTGINNTLINNTGMSNSSSGIAIIAGTNNTLINNNGTSNSSYGILLSSSSKNTLISNTGTSNSNYGIYLRSSSNNNNLTSNTGTSNSSYAVCLNGSNNNVIINQNATGYLSGSIGIAFQNSNNTVVQDCINISGVDGDVLYVTATSSNNIFINCSYRTTGTNETVMADGDLTRKWYYRAYVNDTTGSGVSNANVSAYNVSNSLEFTELTNSSGWTNITTITEYVNLGGTRVYYNNYTINATNSSYTPNLVSHSYNVTLQQNNLMDVFTFNTTAGDNIYPLFYSYWDNNATLIRSGLGLFNVSINNTNGTVLLEINNTNVTAINLSANTYNASYTFTGNGTFSYIWISWGNGTSHNFNTSNTQSYTVNNTPPVYPTFSNYYDNNATLIGSGLGLFNVTLTNTNGTVWLDINNTNITARNLTVNVYNVSYTFATNNTYAYRWWAYGNGTPVLLNQSDLRSYVVNNTDTIYPLFSAFNTTPSNNTRYSPNAIYKFNVTILNSNGTAEMEFNGTNYTMTNETSLFNVSITNLPAGDYNYFFWAYGNGTDKLFNVSQTFSYTIVKNSTYSLIKYLNGADNNLSIIYPQQINASAYAQGGTAKIYRNGTDVTSENGLSISLGAGYWDYNFSVAGNQNYTSTANITLYANISKGIPTGNLINQTSLSITFPQQFNFTISESNTGDLTYSVYRNNTDVSAKAGLNETIGAGAWIYLLNTTGGSNWTSNSSMSNFSLTILKATGIINGTINGTQGNFTSYNGTATMNVYLNATNKTGYGTGKIYFNGTLINSGLLPIFNQTNLSIGVYNVTFVYDGNENYTGVNQTWLINVTLSADYTYPLFYSYWDNNTTINSGGIALFNVSINNTNGTVWLSINGTNYTATNLTTNVYNASVAELADGTYVYNWSAYGNGSLTHFNMSNDRSISLLLYAVSSPVSSWGGGGAITETKRECMKDSDCKTGYSCFKNKCVKLFDVKILEIESPIFPKKFFDLKYLIKGMADIKGDIVIKFWIQNDKQKIGLGQDTIYLGAFEEKTESVELYTPTNIEFGVYDFYVQVNFENYEAKSFRKIEIDSSSEKMEIKTLEETPYVKSEFGFFYSFKSFSSNISNFIKTNKSYFIKVFLILVLFLLFLFAFLKIWKNRQRISFVDIRKKIFGKHTGKYPKNCLRNLIGKAVYSEDGDYTGEVVDVDLKENQIDGLKIKMSSKTEREREIQGIFVKYKYVKDVGHIVLIDKRISEHLENFADN